ncbi:forkhead box protein J1-like [Cuculus canorus]|uniref:forkhead box protein J1-like n=1 Tax=Cuculus canorus TaxID=55661 RepID=UPI0023AA659D|nr:forkhead box protein J1-like [Cuculus canorus]XP_053907694.1 forkhead box protein J1-like [Cuculus canorus]
MAEGRLSHEQAGKDRGQEGIVRDSPHKDDSLPNLTWLLDFSITSASMGNSSCCPSGPDPHTCQGMPSFAVPCSPLGTDPACVGTPHTPCVPVSSSTSKTEHRVVSMHAQLMEGIDYRSNPYVKPPYSYATLICMAMEASEEPHITLSAIYKWITDNFCYFRQADPGWQNSIRHNLSSNKCFIKVPREKGKPGRGGFWKLDPQYADRLKNSTFKKQRMHPAQIHPASTEKAQQEAQVDASPATSGSASNKVFSVSMELQQLLEEFEEFINNQNQNTVDIKAGLKRKQPLPKQMAKVRRLSNSPLLTQEEQTQLGSLKGDFDTDLNRELSTLRDLEVTPPVSPRKENLEVMVHGQNLDCPQGLEQVLAEFNQNDLSLDESCMAASFLQHLFDEGTSDSLSNAVNVEQLFDINDISVPADGSDWNSLASLL